MLAKLWEVAVLRLGLTSSNNCPLQIAMLSKAMLLSLRESRHTIKKRRWRHQSIIKTCGTVSRAHSCNQAFTEDFARWAQRHFVEQLSTCQLRAFTPTIGSHAWTNEHRRTHKGTTTLPWQIHVQTCVDQIRTTQVFFGGSVWFCHFVLKSSQTCLVVGLGHGTPNVTQKKDLVMHNNAPKNKFKNILKYVTTTLEKRLQNTRTRQKHQTHHKASKHLKKIKK